MIKFFRKITQILIPSFLMVTLLVYGCLPKQAEKKNVIINPEGVFAQHLRIEVQDKSEEFKDLMFQLKQIGDSAQLQSRYHWICYQEAPNHYWILAMSDSLNKFAYPASIKGFASVIGEYARSSKRDSIMALAESLKDLPVTESITRQYSNWSTTNNVESRDYPNSRIVTYSFDEADIIEFNNGMVELKGFLEKNQVSFPIEGFLAYPETKNEAWRVIFLPDDTPFDEVHTSYDFQVELSDEAKHELKSIQKKIRTSTNNIEYLDGKRVDSLSYGTL
ncbi:hypothetical protein [Flagellimonas sp. 2504JD4-2]